MLQPYRELRKTFGKGMVIADTASWIFHLAPFAIVGATIAAASLVPVVSVTQPADQLGDLFVLTALLLLGTFFLALGGLDPGTAFGGMGCEPRDDGRGAHRADRRAGDLRARADARSDEPRRDRRRRSATPARALGPGTLLAFAALFIVMLAETGRLPVDNPATHLELTMIHEAMVLEYSGPIPRTGSSGRRRSG